MHPSLVRAILLLLPLAALSALPAAAAPRHASGGTPVALVTAEGQNELLAVSLPRGPILRRVRLPADPENVDVLPNGPAVVVSTKAGAVSILAWRSLRVVKVIRGFRSPHLASVSPDGERAYVTDDATGFLSVIELARTRVVARVFVGVGAHHLACSPDGRRIWIALGERARTIVIVDSSHLARPKVVARFDPGFAAHDLSFSPDGSRVWVTADDSERVTLFGATSRRPVSSIAVGPPPQHVAFGARGYAYVTSGYGSRIVMANTKRVLRSARVPYGSFNIAPAGGLIVVSSLLRGTVTELDDQLHILGTTKVAPAARDVGVSVW
ncbi:MAG: hypothetical protein QOE36_3824 [Gaiellaceae bacterium]|nr:hypothetical protein [Gaiellaceae bacterium]